MKSHVLFLALAVASLPLLTDAADKPEIPEISIKANNPKADAWRELSKASQAALGGEATAAGAGSADRVEVLLATADRLREFAEADAKNPEVVEAKRLELLALFQAAYLGDETRKARRDGLADELRQEGVLPTKYRCELAAWEKNLEVARRSFGSLTAKLEAYERVARQLIAAFPGEVEPYEALLGIAASASPARRAEVAREILAMSAPEAAKERARAVEPPRP